MCITITKEDDVFNDLKYHKIDISLMPTNPFRNLVRVVK